MIYKQKAMAPGWIEVLFELPDSLWADRVTLVGNFNGWDERSLPFRQEQDGCWRLRMLLPVGQSYYFCYVIDGRWCNDDAAPCAEGVVPARCGRFNYGCILDTTLDGGVNGEETR